MTTNAWGITFTAGVAVVVLAAVASRVPRIREWAGPPLKAFFLAIPTVRISTRDSREKAAEEARREGRDEAEGQVAAQRARRIPKPKWRVQQFDVKPRTYVLINYEPRAVTRDVVLSAPPDRFTILGSGSFEDSEFFVDTDRRVVRFDGEFAAAGKKSGVTFKVEYTDENGDLQEGEAYIDPPPPPPPARVSTARIVRGSGR
jgi:hypothetical protein